jgi:hypothetical protein
MATVTLTELHLHDEANHSLYVRTYGYAGYGQSTTTAASRRVYANGRARMVTRSGTLKTKEVVFPAATAAVVTQLAAWVSTVLMLRDPFGDVLRGFYSSFTQEAVTGGSGFTTVAFTFEQVSITGEV